MPGPIISEVVADFEEDLIPTRTYMLDFETKRINGFIDEQEAIVQAVRKILATERVSFPIYGTEEGLNYGVEMDRLIGKPHAFVESDIERTISDAIMQDERVLGMSNFEVLEKRADIMLVSFTVETLYGNIQIEEEASIL